MKICPQCGNPGMIQKDREAECQFCGFKQCEECSDSFREIQDNNEQFQGDNNGSR